MPEKCGELGKCTIAPGPKGGLVLTQELIEDFLKYLAQKGRAGETISAYRSYLNRLYTYLQDDREIVQGTLDGFLDNLEEEGYLPNSINVSISVANSLFEYCGRRDLQMPKRARCTRVQPEITRAEYQRLLQAARRLGREQAYLLTKLFACTGIGLSDLKNLTIEAVRIGRVMARGEKGETIELVLPQFLCDELENFAERQDIAFGPVFINRAGRPLSRSTVAQLIADLSKEAGVAREKCNPRCLQKMCAETKSLVEKNLLLHMQQIYENLLEQEQQTIGWMPQGENAQQTQPDTEQ